MDKIMQMDAALSTLVRVLIIQERRISNDISAVSFNPLDLEVLSFLGNQPNVPAKNIATYLQVSPTTMQSAIDRLEKRGFLVRDKAALKGRAIAISLTADGVQFRDLMHATNLQNCKLMLEVINPLDQERFVDSMVKIAAKMTKAL